MVEQRSNRNVVLIVAVILFLCLCCALAVGLWFGGDALVEMFGF
jgi:hypothetical protein